MATSIPHPLVSTIGIIAEEALNKNTNLSPDQNDSYVYATQNITAVEGQKFEIIFKRVGALSFDGMLQLQFGGTATPDVDYTSDQSWSGGRVGYLDLNLPAGQEFVSLKFTAQNDSISDSLETVRVIEWWIGPRPLGKSIQLFKSNIFDNTEGSYTSAVIVDTNFSSSQPTYKITSSTTSVNEGGTATFILNTTNVASGTSIPYTLSGISAGDVLGGALSGNAIVNSSGNANITLTLVNDALTEGPETLTVTAGGSTASTVINDTSNTNPSYVLTSSSTTLSEGSSVTVTLTTKNVKTGQGFYIFFPENSSNGYAHFYDVAPGSTGVPGQSPVWIKSIYGMTNSLGVASFTFGINNDKLTEGDELLTISLRDTLTGSFNITRATLDLLIKDTSTAPPYSLSADSPSFNEGSTATFTLITNNIASGTLVPFTISGVNTADVVGGLLSGNVVVNLSGVATISVGLQNDFLTEGLETLTISAGGTSASIVVNDTSKNSSATYSLIANSTTINEGSAANFTLQTTNLPNGTSVPYTLSGISSADIVNGSLSGNAVIHNGSATILVTFLNDEITEGIERVTINAGGASAWTDIMDSSTARVVLSPTYSIFTNWTSTTEGTPIVATVTTTNVTSGTTLYYQLSGSGITTNDFGGLPLAGSSVVNSLGQASLTIPLALDTTTEGDETFSIQYFTDPGRTVIAGSAAFVTIRDTSKGAVTPSYTVVANNSSVNEGSAASFTISTSNVAAGSSISYALSGVSSSDITGGALSGVAIINSSGTATVSVPIAADNLTEGTETLTITLQGKTASTLINDTSKAAVIPTYNLVAESPTVNEGSVATFNLITTNVAPGTTISYTLSGVSATDITGGLNGTATVDANGLATISIPLAADFLTEGNETLAVISQGKTASVLINDTSKTALIASYALSASSIAVSEGSNAVFTLTTVNVPGGTAIPYTVTGVNASDITGGSLSGTVIVNTSGSATIFIPISADLLTEGRETLTVTAQQVSASVVISDSSLTPNSVATVSTEAPFIPYGSGRFFLPTSGAEKITGTDFLDVVRKTSNHDANQIARLADGSWRIQNKANSSNTDTLVNIERVNFEDVSLALDVSGLGGQIAKILGVVFGPAAVKNTGIVGLGLAYLDNGVSYKALAKVAADAAGLSSPDAVVSTLWKNLFGFTATQADKAPYIKMINDGMSVGDFVTFAADSSVNEKNIGYLELLNTGLQFIPYSIPAEPTYALSSKASVNEGETTIIQLTTTNVSTGTLLDYSISGVDKSDIVSGLTGKVSVDASGKAVINLITTADLMTEGTETMTISLGSATAQVVINDTSITFVGIIDDGGGGGGGGGD